MGDSFPDGEQNFYAEMTKKLPSVFTLCSFCVFRNKRLPCRVDFDEPKKPKKQWKNALVISSLLLPGFKIVVTIIST